MLRLIHGNDEFTIANSLKSYLEALGPPELRAPNVTVFEAPNAPMGEVFAAAKISPFLTDRRAVVVKGMLSPFETRGAKVRPDWESFGDRIADEAMQIVNDLIFVENEGLRLTSGPQSLVLDEDQIVDDLHQRSDLRRERGIAVDIRAAEDFGIAG